MPLDKKFMTILESLTPEECRHLRNALGEGYGPDHETRFVHAERLLPYLECRRTISWCLKRVREGCEFFQMALPTEDDPHCYVHRSFHHTNRERLLQWLLERDKITREEYERWLI